jgi:16S rRNA (adenine1518-N6/adenine1519-N6)-dimethyltransferase
MNNRRHRDLRPDKSLGQHFLDDRSFLTRIIQESEVEPGDSILEIGPGTGNLTSLLLEKARRVVAVEFDRRLMERLESLSKRYPGRLTLYFQDFLGSDLSRILGVSGPRWKVVANIPYYITSPIIEKLILQGGSLVTDIFLTVQKEIALRLCAVPGSRETGSSSLFVQYYCEPALLFTIPRSAFTPPPEVDSAFIRLRVRETPPVTEPSSLLFPLIHHVFRQRRKGIRNSLKGFPPAGDDRRIAYLLAEAGIDGLARPESLTIERFNTLALFLEEKR